MIKVGINGLGRIGRHVFRGLISDYPELCQIVAVNDLAPADICAHLISHDSVYGQFEIEVCEKDGDIYAAGKKIKKFSGKSPVEIDWDSVGVDIVIESTGRFRTGETASGHRSEGVKKVIITAPAKGEDITIVPGVNLDAYDPAKHDIVSCASCTTNCVAQIIKNMDDNYKIKRCNFITVHAYSNDQGIIDEPHLDFRRSRALAFNIIPTTTGATGAIIQVLPELDGKITSGAYRVPVECGSLVDCTFELETLPTAEEINEMFLNVTKGENGKYVGITFEELVSADFKKNIHSCIVDSKLTSVSCGTARVIGWYDNEYSYSMRVCNLLEHIINKGV